MHRIRPIWKLFGLATASILLVIACAPAAPPAPTAAPAKPTTAPLARLGAARSFSRGRGARADVPEDFQFNGGSKCGGALDSVQRIED